MEGRPRYRACARWEESVPNPAPHPATSLCLNAALMGWGSCGLLAVADAVRLHHIVERHLVGDALRRDPQRPGRDDVDLALSEIGGPAAVGDHRRCALVVE